MWDKKRRGKQQRAEDGRGIRISGNQSIRTSGDQGIAGSVQRIAYCVDSESWFVARDSRMENRYLCWMRDARGSGRFACFAV